ncbi:MAG: penicillin acylase family protein, partial [Flavobacteriaceae bacterium]
DQITGELPMSMSGIDTQYENTGMNARYGMAHATEIDGFRAALPDRHAPGLKIREGEAKGKVAWWATAKLYEMPDSTHVKRILETDKVPLRYLDFDENPQAINPPSGYVYSANNQPDSISIGLYPGYYLPENRAKRIVQLLEPKNDWDREAVSEMINDATSAVDPLVVKDLSKALDIKELDSVQIEILDHLNAWDGNYTLESVDAVVYTRWVYFFLYNVFHDELGEAYFKQFLATHFQKRLIAPMAHKETSVWFDDITTKGQTETKQDIVSQSFNETLQSLTDDFGGNMEDWTWDKVHTLEMEHPIGKVKALRSFFNVGPFPVVGSREVINNLAFVYDGTGYYKVSSGPSTRRVIDFSDVENSISILPTGQSGNPFSPFYKDQSPLYIKGQFRKMLMNKDTIQSSKSTLLRFTPQSD